MLAQLQLKIQELNTGSRLDKKPQIFRDLVEFVAFKLKASIPKSETEDPIESYTDTELKNKIDLLINNGRRILRKGKGEEDES